MKRGISLIAVLMFMLAATTASIVLFKWLGSENFASGARLKQSEAYQASESGLDAVQAWLSYKAADVGGVLNDYLASNKNPYFLSSANFNVLANWNSSKQDFKVYLIGADVTSKPYKLKFMSIGRGRDGSEVSQTAIFNVEGLYRANIPVRGEIRRPQTTDYNEDFWGNMGTAHTISSMRVVMTQTAEFKNAGGQGLNTIKIGRNRTDSAGYLILDGNYYVNNGMNIYGDVYSTGIFDFCPSGNGEFITGNLYIKEEFHPKGALKIEGDAFFNGGVNPNANINDASTGGTGGCQGGANGGVVLVEGNSTIGDNFVYYNNSNGGGLGFHVRKNLVMNRGSIYLTRQSGNNTDSLAADGNVHILNNLMGTVPSADTKPIPFFGRSNSTSTVCVPNMNTATGSGTYTYTDKTTSSIKMRSNKSSLSTSCASADWGADPMDGTKSGKNWLAKLQEGSSNKSCENTPIKFDMEIYTRSVNGNDNWVHKASKPGSCAVENGKLKLDVPWVTLDEQLKDCYKKAETAGELKDGWLVVHLKNYQFNTTTQKNDNLLCDKIGGAKCKYILIFDFEPSNAQWAEFLYLPPTGSNAEVMIYLPNGSPYIVELSGGVRGANNTCPGELVNGSCPIKAPYNYFIFSDGNIKQFNTTDVRTLTGNVFMNKCSIMNDPNTQGNPYFISQGNTELVAELTEANILQKNDGSGFTGGTGTTVIEIAEDKDNYIIPLSPRLKIELESKSISKEPEPQPQPSKPLGTAKQSVLVMPRALRLPRTALSSTTPLSNYYQFLYLNGAQQPSSLTRTCRNAESTLPNLNETAPVEGVYVCEFNNEMVSEFYVKIEDSAPFPDPLPPDPEFSSSSSYSSVAESSSSSSILGNISSSSSSDEPSSSSGTSGFTNCPYPDEWCNPTENIYSGSSYSVIPPINNRPNSLITSRSYNFIGGYDEEFPERCIFVTSIQSLGNHGKWYKSPSTNVENFGFIAGFGDPRPLGTKALGARNVPYASYYPIRVNGKILVTNPTEGTDEREGRCGGNGQTWQNKLYSCNEAISQTGGIERTNGGYYLYLPPGWVMENFQVTGGVPSCPGGATLNCSGLQSTATRGSIISTPTLTCSNEETPSSISWANGPSTGWEQGINGWQVASNALIGREYNITATATCGSVSNLSASCGTTTVVSSSSTTPTATCSIDMNTLTIPTSSISSGNPCFRISKPTINITCNPSSSNVTDATFSTSATGSPIGWSTGTTEDFCPGTGLTKNIYLTSVKCGGQSATITTGLCGSFTLPSITPPTATCNFSNTSVYVGQNIGAPTITCDDNSIASLSNATFSGDVPTNWTNWKSSPSGNAYYPGNTTTTSGKNISVSGITCGGTAVSNIPNCNSITVSKPTCSVPNSITSGTAFTPTISCGGSTVTVIDFTPSSGCSWTASGSGGSLTRSSTGNCALTLNGLKCGSNPISSIGKDCGSIDVTTSTPTCVGQQNLATYCGSSFNWANLKTNYTVDAAIVPPKGCYFTTNAIDLQLQGASFKINGVTKTSCSSGQNCTNGITPVDGGYYLDLSNTFTSSYWTKFTASVPDCSGGTPSTCTSIAKAENFTPTANSCYNYTSCSGTLKGCIDGGGPINLSIECNGQTNSYNNVTQCHEDFWNCGNGHTAKITVTSNTNSKQMNMDCW